MAFAGARAQEEIPAPGTSGGDAAAPSTEAAEAEITQRRQQLAKLESLELRFRNQQRDLKDELANIQSNPQLLWEDLKEGISVMLSHPDVNLEAPDKPGYVMKTIPSSFVASDKTSVEEVTRLRRQFNDLVGLILDRMKSQLRDDRVRAEPEKTAVEQEIDALLVELEQKADAPNE